jgi:phage shock protein A
MAQHRRSRALSKTSDARMAAGGGVAVATFDRMKHKVSREEAVSQAKAELAGDDFEDRLAALGKEDEIDKMLSELKARRSQS